MEAPTVGVGLTQTVGELAKCTMILVMLETSRRLLTWVRVRRWQHGSETAAAGGEMLNGKWVALFVSLSFVASVQQSFHLIVGTALLLVLPYSIVIHPLLIAVSHSIVTISLTFDV